MEGPDQATLKELWTSGRRGTLCPKEMMKAWGIAWCMKNHFKKEVNYEAIAGDALPQAARSRRTFPGSKEASDGRADDGRGEGQKGMISWTAKPPAPP